MPTIEANGLQMGYQAVGDGSPLIVLHGATFAGSVGLAAQVDRLAGTFRVYRPDARGHGSTRWDAADGFSTADLVADLGAFADALDLQTFHLLGFSMGAMTALTFATRHPERLRTLVLIGIAPDREPRASVARRALDPIRIERDDPAWARKLGAVHDPGQGLGAWQRLLPAIAADVATQPLLTPTELRRADQPTLVACGDRDPFTPVVQAWELARTLPDARLLVAPRCGHEVLSERAEIFHAAVTGFYRETELAARRRAARPAESASPGVDTVSTPDEGAE